MNKNSRRIIISIECSFMARENGSHSRIEDLISFFDSNFEDVVVYSFHEHIQYPWDHKAISQFRAKFPNISLALDHHTWVTRLATRTRNALLSLFPSLAGPIARWRVPGTPQWRQLLHDHPSAVHVINFIDVATIINGLPTAPILIETHDIKSFKAAKISAQHPSSLRIIAKFRSETSLLSLAKGLIAITPYEQNLLGSIAPGPKVLYISSYSVTYPAAAATMYKPKYDLAFIGADNNFNVDGLVAFVDVNTAWLQGRTLAVAGLVCSNPKIISLAANHGQVTLLGFIDDLQSFYSDAKAVISPVDGTGLKIKLVEALSFGKPVFASQHSRDGLPTGSERAVFQIDPVAMDYILDDKQRLDEAHIEAKKYYRHFITTGDLDQLQEFIATL